MIKFQKQFFIGMDKDTNLQDMKEGSYRDALNLRVGSTERGNLGKGENIKGNKEIEVELPPGFNMVTGSLGDERTQSILYFLYNDSGTTITPANWVTATAYNYGAFVHYLDKDYVCIHTHNPTAAGYNIIATGSYNPITLPFWEEYTPDRHQILQFFPHGSSPYVNKIFEWGPLGFVKEKKVHSSWMVNNMLYWTDEWNIPRKINIDRAYENKLLVANVAFDVPGTVTGDVYFMFSSPDGTIENKVIICTVTAASMAEVLAQFEAAFNAHPVASLYFSANAYNGYVQLTSKGINGNWTLALAFTGGAARVVHQNMYQRPYVQEYFSQLKPRLDEPEAQLVEASTLPISINGKEIAYWQFQFIQRAIYKDGEKGAWSPLTRLIEPASARVNEEEQNRWVISLKPNFEKIGKFLSDIEYLEVAFRQYETDTFKLIKAYRQHEFAHGGITVYFDNSHAYFGIDKAELVTQSYNVPRVSTASAITKDRAFLVRGKAGYTLPDMEVSFEMGLLDTSIAYGYTRALKTGSRGQLGIVFYDEYKTQSLVYTNDVFRYYIPFISEDMAFAVPDCPIMSTPTKRSRYLTYDFHDSVPPVWAHTAQWVKTRDINYDIFAVVSPSGRKYANAPYNPDGTTTFYPTSGVGAYVEGTSPVYGVHIDGYRTDIEFEVGDIVRERKIAPTGAKQIREWVVAGRDAEFWVVLKPIGTNGQDNQVAYMDLESLELRKPKKTEDNLFYETGCPILISNPGSSQRSFTSPTGIIDIYDAYQFTGQGSGIVSSEYMFFAIGGTPPGRSYNTGNANISNFSSGEVSAPTTICFSDKYIPGTNINGLSSFQALNSKIFPVEYGPIQKLVAASNEAESGVLLVIHENETVSVRIEAVQFEDTEGSNLIAQSAQVLGSFNTLKGNYGTLNPESVVRHRDNVYWYDLKKSSVIRYGGNGLDNLSYVLMRTWFEKKSKLLRRYYASDDYREQIKVYGTFDPNFDEFILTFPEVRDILTDEILVEAETLAWNEDNKRWVTFYSYIPEYMDKVGDVMVTYKNGKLYIH